MSEKREQIKNQNHRITTSVLIKTSFWYTVSSYLTHAIGFITTPIFTRILSKGEYGDFSVYVNWQSILVMLCGLEVFNTINRARFDFVEEKEFDSYITSCLFLSSIVTVILFTLYLLFSKAFYIITLVEHKHMIIMFMYAFTMPAFSMFQAKQRITYQYKLNATISFVLVIASSILAVYLANTMIDKRITGRIIGQFILYILAGLICYVCFINKQISFNTKYIKYAIQIAIPLVINHVASSILMSSDNFVVKHMCSSEIVSDIALSHTFTNIIVVLVRTLNGAWSPWFYDQLHDQNNNHIKKVFSLYVWVVIALTLSALLLGPEITILLGGAQYKTAIQILPLVVLNGVFTVLLSQFVYLETYYKRNKYAGIITGVGALFNVLIDIVGVKIWDYRAVCYATVITQILMIVAHYKVTVSMGIRQILPAKDIVKYVLVSLFLIPLSLCLYRNNLLRYSFIGLLLVGVVVIGLVYRKKIKSFIARIRSR